MMEEDKKYKYLFKIVLIGDASVGKTCLVRRYAKGFFVGSPGATIGVDFLMKNVDVDGEIVKVSSELTGSTIYFSTNIDIFFKTIVKVSVNLKNQRLSRLSQKQFENQIKQSDN